MAKLGLGSDDRNAEIGVMRWMWIFGIHPLKLSLSTAKREYHHGYSS